MAAMPSRKAHRNLLPLQNMPLQQQLKRCLAGCICKARVTGSTNYSQSCSQPHRNGQTTRDQPAAADATAGFRLSVPLRKRRVVLVAAVFLILRLLGAALRILGLSGIFLFSRIAAVVMAHFCVTSLSFSLSIAMDCENIQLPIICSNVIIRCCTQRNF